MHIIKFFFISLKNYCVVYLQFLATDIVTKPFVSILFVFLINQKLNAHINGMFWQQLLEMEKNARVS